MFVETLGSLVFGVNQHGKHTEFGASRALQRIGQKNSAEPLALVITGRGKPSKQHCRHDRIAREFLGDLGATAHSERRWWP